MLLRFSFIYIIDTETTYVKQKYLYKTQKNFLLDIALSTFFKTANKLPPKLK